MILLKKIVYSFPKALKYDLVIYGIRLTTCILLPDAATNTDSIIANSNTSVDTNNDHTNFYFRNVSELRPSLSLSVSIYNSLNYTGGHFD